MNPAKKSRSTPKSSDSRELSSDEAIKSLKNQGITYHYGRGNVVKRPRSFSAASPYKTTGFRLGLLACVLVVVLGVFNFWLQRQSLRILWSELSLSPMQLEGDSVAAELHWYPSQGDPEVVLKCSLRPKNALQQRIEAGSSITFILRKGGQKTFEQSVVFEADATMSAASPAVLQVRVPKPALSSKSVVEIRSTSLGLDAQRALFSTPPTPQ